MNDDLRQDIRELRRDVKRLIEEVGKLKGSAAVWGTLCGALGAAIIKMALP